MAPQHNQICFELSDELLRHAKLHVIRRRMGRVLLLLILIISLGLLVVRLTSNIDLLTLLVPGTLLCILVGFFIWKDVKKPDPVLSKLPSRRVTCSFTDEAFESRGPLGESRFEWRMFEKLSRFGDVWLLYLTPDKSLPLPADSLSDEVREFITAKVQEHGGKVEGRLNS